METRVDLTVGGTRRRLEIRGVLVDTGATLSAVDRRTAETVGIAPTRRERFQTAQGVAEFDIGLASLAILGREVRQEVVILDGGPTVVGLLTLEQARFKVDTLTGVLEPAGPLNLI